MLPSKRTAHQKLLASLAGKMKVELSTLVILIIDGSCAAMLEGKDACGNDLALGGMQSFGGVYWGFLPNCCNRRSSTLMSTINGLTGKHAST
ncbi:hypothetical protein HO173_011167 [Letharia columbiana]|uniref:Uncharacterized protein n=1 Tax=Letharia columbiana TaxID=112416 RepID=A0A8H6FLD5_9LECA|nr:uncharacterized protein HO173_011167 [Letharia columbiana]KAF6230630.1 hypothetical protein HO173_011167 [Letharia columbiana]